MVVVGGVSVVQAGRLRGGGRPFQGFLMIPERLQGSRRADLLIGFKTTASGSKENLR